MLPVQSESYVDGGPTTVALDPKTEYEYDLALIGDHVLRRYPGYAAMPFKDKLILARQAVLDNPLLSALKTAGTLFSSAAPYVVKGLQTFFDAKDKGATSQ